MAAGVFQTIREWIGSPDEEYEVESYVLTRREPDPENRIREYDSPVESGTIEADESLPPGTYILQEIKPSGMAGDVVWEEELGEG